MKLCLLVVAVAIIARARVAVLPGWVVPLPVLLLVAELAACAAVAAWAIGQARREAFPASQAAAGEGPSR